MGSPNLMLIGAPRAGTTWLWTSLARNPEIFAPPIKGPHFHLADRWPLGGPEARAFTRPLAQFRRGVRPEVWGGLMTDPDQYAALYDAARGARWRLEGTPNYFAEGREMALRMAGRLPAETRIVVTLRDPVARTLSHYRLFRKLGWENLSFADAIAAGPSRCAAGWAPTWDYLRYSRIRDPLAAWQEVFGSRLFVLSLQAMRLTPHESLARLFDWLDVPASGIAPMTRRASNTAARIAAPGHKEAAAIIAATDRIDLAAERAALAECQRAEPELPLVSVGMPVRNGAGTIAAALDTLRAQSYPALDIVVCDNASTDATPRIVEECAARDPRVRLARFETGVGIQDSYRRALESRRGRYFLFAPADDSWSPGFVEAAVHRMQHDPDLAVCCGQITMHDDAGRQYPSPGTRPIRGTPQQRWKRGLLLTGDASRLYGLLRADRLDGIIPASDPEGWDQYTTAKLALRGPVARLKLPAMRRHQTPHAHYRALIAAQEPTWFGRMTFARHVVALIRSDPEFETRSPGSRLALVAYQLGHAAQNLPGPVLPFTLRPLLVVLAHAIGGLALVVP